MDKNTKKSKRRKKQNIQDFEIEQDENFRFIVGYTSGGFPYGNPWEKSDDNYNDEEDVFIESEMSLIKIGDAIMAVSYKRLWKLLVDKEMSKSDLRKKAEIAPNTMTKLRRDEEVSLTILSKICKTLNTDFGDIVEYIPDAEIWDLYDENRELIGRDHVRGEQLPIDGYHLVVHVWIRNSKGEYLISQRSANRPTYPLMWECVGGSVVKGEDSLLGAIREVKEEVGVDLNPENGQVLFTKTRKIIDGKIFNDIMDVWLFEYDGEVDLGNATTDEVAQVTWMNREQIKELFEHNMFVETLRYFFTEVDK